MTQSNYSLGLRANNSFFGYKRFVLVGYFGYRVKYYMWDKESGYLLPMKIEMKLKKADFLTVAKSDLIGPVPLELDTNGIVNCTVVHLGEKTCMGFICQLSKRVFCRRQFDLYRAT